MAADPLFTTLDIGQPGSARYIAGTAEALVRVVAGPLRTAGAEFAYPGLGGIYRSNEGTRGRLIVWQCVLLCQSHALLNTIEGEIEIYVAAATETTMTWHGKTRNFVRLAEYRRTGPREPVRPTGWVMQAAELVFEDME